MTTQAHQRYVLVETLISIAINLVISATFAWIVFHGRTRIPLWGAEGYAIDFAPQTFMIALMSVVVPTLITRRRTRLGKVQPRAVAKRGLPARLWLRAPLLAVAATLVLGGVVVGLISVALPDTLGFPPLLALKLAYAAVIAGVMTPIGLRAALADP